MGSFKAIEYSRIEDLTFRVYTEDEIEKISIFNITNPVSLNNLGHFTENGIYDPRLGQMSIHSNELCKTCNNKYSKCSGHYGRIEFPLPICNTFFYDVIKQLIERICPTCFRFQVKALRGIQFVYECMLFNAGYDIQSMDMKNIMGGFEDFDEATEVAVTTDEKEDCNMSNQTTDELYALERKAKRYFKHIKKSCEPFKSATSNSQTVFNSIIKEFLLETAKSKNKCIHCGLCLLQPKIQYAKIYIRRSMSDNQKKIAIEKGGIVDVDQPFLTPKQAKKMLRECYKRDGLIIKHVYPFLTKFDIPYPTDVLFMQKLLVTPPRYRPCIFMKDSVIENNIGHLYNNAIKFSKCISYLIKNKDKDLSELPDTVRFLVSEFSGESIIEKCHNLWQELQSTVDNIQDATVNPKNVISNVGIRQFIEKKFGLFRQNLMGKRVDFSARSVAAPDAMLSVDEVGVPMDFALRLTYPVPVTPWNVARLRKMVENGPCVYPGALMIEDEEGQKISLKAGDDLQRIAIAKSLLTPAESCVKKVNSSKIVYRHLMSGDYVLMNRQPTLHKPSIQAHKARVLPKDRVLRMPYANCKAYNADFDGDELNLHFPQNEVARSEAQTIVTTRNQYLTPKDGSPLAGLIQDCVVGCVMLTVRGKFFNVEDYHQLVFSAVGHLPRKLHLLPPAIQKPERLWSGKQVISTILLNLIPKGKPGPTFDFQTKVRGDLWQKEAPRKWRGGGEPETRKESMTESEFVMREGELVCGVVDKCAIGSTSYGLVHTCHELYGGGVSTELLTAISRLCVIFLQWNGHTISLKEFVTPTATSVTRRNDLKDLIQETKFKVSKKLGVERDLTDHVEFLHKTGNEKELAAVDAAYTSVLGPATSSITRENEKNLLRNNLQNNMKMMVDTGAKGSKVNMNQMASLFGSVAIDGKRMPMSITGKTLPSFKPYECDPRAGGYIPTRFVTGMDPKSYFFLCIVGRDSLQHTAVKTANSGYMQRCLIKHLEGIHVEYDMTVRNADGVVLQFDYGEDGLDVTKVPFLKNVETINALFDNYKKCLDSKSLSLALTTTNSEAEKYKKKSKKHVEEQKSKRDGPFLKFCRELGPSGSPVKANKSVGRSTESLRMMQKWYKLDKEKKKFYSDPFEKTTTFQNPVTSKFNGGSHLGVVSEALDSLIDQYYNEKYSTRRKEERELSKPEVATVLHMKALMSKVDPGEAVGALCAQAIGEPLTQMTLNTFHFAGKDELNVTLGVPRMIEILRTASTTIKTPVMSVPFKPHVTESTAEKLRVKLTPVPLDKVINKVRVTTSLERNKVLYKKAEVEFQFLPRREYKKVFCVKPKDIINYMENTYFKNILIFDITATINAVNKYGSSIQLKESKDIESEENTNVGGNDLKGGEEDEETSEDEEKEEATDVGMSGSARQQKLKERDYSEDEDEEAEIEDKVEGKEEEMVEETDERKEKINKVQDLKDFGLCDVEEDEGIVEDQSDENRDLDATEVESERVRSGLKVESQHQKPEIQRLKAIIKQKVISKHSWIEDYEFDEENYLWCKITLSLPIAEGRYDINSIIQSSAKRCFVHQFGKIKKAFVVKKEDHLLLRTEGVCISKIFGFENILDVKKLYTNNIHLMADMYGIEAAQRSVINEIREVQKAYDINVDFRHLSLLADYFTCEGMYKACSRHALNTCASPIQKMSFETCFHFLRKSVIQGLPDKMHSPSASVLVGQPIKIGTNSIEILSKFNC